MGKTITKSKPQNDIKRADQLMRSYAELKREKDSLTEQFNEGLAPTIASMKAAEIELIEIGKRNRKAFDEKGNLMFDDGYIHIAYVTAVQVGNAFSMTKFMKKFSEYVKIDFKIAPMTKAWFDGDERNALMEHDLELKKNEEYQVKVSDKKK